MPKEQKMAKLRAARRAKQLTIGKPRLSSSKNHSCMDVVEELVSKLEVVYRSNRNDTNAAEMKRYLRGQFDFFGIKMPQRRLLDKQICKDTVLDEHQIHRLMKLLWTKPEREYQQFGIDYTRKHIKTFMGSDVTSCQAAKECTSYMICTKSWWDTVDMVASNVVGPMVRTFPQTMLPTMDEWVEGEDMWLRRTAIIHQLNFKESIDQKRLFRYCLKCAHEDEFFIQKAIGWSLRQYYRVNKDAVKKFVKDNENKLSNLSKREALKHDN